MEWWKEPFFQVALPLIIALYLNNLHLSKRIDDLRDSMNRRLDEIKQDIREIKELLKEHDRDIAALKERAGLVKVK